MRGIDTRPQTRADTRREARQKAREISLVFFRAHLDVIAMRKQIQFKANRAQIFKAPP